MSTAKASHRFAWTATAARWAAVAVLGVASLAGLKCSLDAQARRDDARQLAARTALRLDVNTASKAELELLPGIGPARAADILRDREANGPFASLDDLARISGIGPRTIADLEPFATVANPER